MDSRCIGGPLDGGPALGMERFAAFVPRSISGRTGPIRHDLSWFEILSQPHYRAVRYEDGVKIFEFRVPEGDVDF